MRKSHMLKQKSKGPRLPLPPSFETYCLIEEFITITAIVKIAETEVTWT